MKKQGISLNKDNPALLFSNTLIVVFTGTCRPKTNILGSLPDLGATFL